MKAPDINQIKKQERFPAENAEKCVVCNSVIPEGRQVRKICEDSAGKNVMSRKVNEVRFVNSDGSPIRTPWICFSEDIEPIIKDACGQYPSEWNGRPCADIIGVVYEGLCWLKAEPERFRYLESGRRWGTVETATMFMEQVFAICNILRNLGERIIIERE